MTCASSSCRPSSAARADRGLVAEQGDVGDAALEQGARRAQDPVVVALGQHDVLAVRARLVEQRVLEHQRGHDGGPGDVDRREQPAALDVLLEQRERAVDLPLRLAGQPPTGARGGGRGAERAHVRADDRDARVEALDQPRDARCGVEAAVEDDPGEGREALSRLRGEQAQHDVRAVARGDDDRAVVQAVEQVLERHRADEDVDDLTGEQRLVADDEPAVHRVHELPDGRRHQQRVVREGPGRELARRDRGADLVEVRRRAPVRHDTDHLGVVDRQLADRDLGDLTDRVGGPVVPGHDEQHGRPEVRGDPGVERELRRARDVRVVRADDHDDVALALDLVVPGEDLGQGGLGVGVNLLVRHADALLVGQVHAVVREQQLEHVVRGVGRPGDRSEHAHPLDGAGQQVDDAEGDGRLPRVALG